MCWARLPHGLTITPYIARTWGITAPWYIWFGDTPPPPVSPWPMQIPYPYPQGLQFVDDVTTPVMSLQSLQLPGIPWPDDTLAIRSREYGQAILSVTMEYGTVLPFLKDPRGWDAFGYSHTDHVMYWDLRELSRASPGTKRMVLDAVRCFWTFDVVSSILMKLENSLILFIEPWGYGIHPLANTCWSMFIRAKMFFKLVIMGRWITDPQFGPMNYADACLKINRQPVSFKFLRLTLISEMGFHGFHERFVQGPTGPPYRALTLRNSSRDGEIQLARRISDIRSLPHFGRPAARRTYRHLGIDVLHT